MLNGTNSDSWDEPPFEIPAGASSHTEVWREHFEFPATADIRIWGVFPHMHLAGTSIDAWIERDSTKMCLANIPAWDFEWQRNYLYEGSFEELPKVETGDTLVISCTFDNSESNPILMEYSEGHEISDIGVGEGTFDEMCAVLVGITY